MATFIDFIKDKLGNIIYPITREKAVFDDNNVRLDNKLADLPKQFKILQGGIEITENADMNNPIYREIGNYYCRSTAIALTVFNLPEQRAFIMNVHNGNGESYPVQEITFLGTRNCYSRYLETSNETYSPWRKVLLNTDIINNDTTGGTDKVFSAEAGKMLGQEIDTAYGRFVNYPTLTTGTIIPSGADIATYRTFGVYSCASSAIASTLVNCPLNAAFRLVVSAAESGGTCIQTFTRNTGQDMYVRRISDSSVGTTYRFVGTAV